MEPELVVEGGIDEGIVAGRAHGNQVTRDLDDVDVPLVQDGELLVDVSDEVHHLEGQPADSKAHDRDGEHPEGLLLGFGPFVLAGIGSARDIPPPQVVGDGAEGDRYRQKREYVGQEEHQARVQQPLSLLVLPKLFTDDHVVADGVEIQVVGVQRRGNRGHDGE